MISIKDNKYLPKENTDKISIIKNMTAVTHFPLECIYFHLVSHNKVFSIPGTQQVADTVCG